MIAYSEFIDITCAGLGALYNSLLFSAQYSHGGRVEDIQFPKSLSVALFPSSVSKDGMMVDRSPHNEAVHRLNVFMECGYVRKAMDRFFARWRSFLIRVSAQQRFSMMRGPLRARRHIKGADTPGLFLTSRLPARQVSKRASYNSLTPYASMSSTPPAAPAAISVPAAVVDNLEPLLIISFLNAV